MIQEEKINYYAKNIAKELCEMPSFNMDSVEVMLKSRIRIMLYDVLKNEVSELEKKRSEMVEEYTSTKVPAWRKLELQPKIASINVQIKQSRSNMDVVRISKEFELLKKECNKVLPPEFMERFYELQKELR